MIHSLSFRLLLSFAACMAVSSARSSSAAASSTLPSHQPGALTTASTASPVVSDAVLTKLIKILDYGEPIGPYKPAKGDAAIALGLIGDERAIPALSLHYDNESNNHLRFQLVKALGWIGTPAVVPTLEKALQDAYPYTRKQAAVALKTITGRDYDYDKSGLPDRAKMVESLRREATTP